MVTFVNLSPEEEESRRATIIQSWRNQQGKVYARVEFYQVSERTFYPANGVLYFAQYENAANGAISTILVSIALSRSDTVKTVLGDVEANGVLDVSGYLNGERLYKQTWLNKPSSNPLNGMMSQSDALAMCKRSLEDKMKLEARGE